MKNPLRQPFRYTYFNATLILVAINVLVYLVTRADPYLYSYLSMNPINTVYHHMWWQPLSAMFVHGSFEHLFFNMLGLLLFGLNLEKSMGSKEFLLFYMICGLLANLFSLGIYVLTGTWIVFLMGASGAVYSILFAFAVIFPTVRVFIFGIIPVPGPIMVLIYAVVELGSQMLGLNGGVAHMTHLFGFAAAWAYFLIRIGVNPIKVWKNVFRH